MVTASAALWRHHNWVTVTWCLHWWQSSVVLSSSSSSSSSLPSPWLVVDSESLSSCISWVIAPWTYYLLLHRWRWRCDNYVCSCRQRQQEQQQECHVVSFTRQTSSSRRHDSDRDAAVSLLTLIKSSLQPRHATQVWHQWCHRCVFMVVDMVQKCY